MAKLGRIVAPSLMILLGCSAGHAQVCTQNGPVIGLIEYADTVPGPVNGCGFACNTPRPMDVQYETRPAGCDPSLGTCTIRATIPYEFPGNKQNTMTFGQSPVLLEWTDSQGSGAGSCGGQGLVIDSDRADAWTQLPGFQCSTTGTFGDLYNLRARICVGFTFCPMPVRNTEVDLTRPAIESAVCPDPPRPWSCNESNSCQSGCMGPNGSGAAGSGAGGSSAAGGGPGLGGRIFGGGAFLRYQAGGIGAAGNPLPADWTPLLGRYWSHDYAERIVPDPDDSHVWLLTKHATYREFTDSDMDGVYDVAAPSDEYRQLSKTLDGWELRELDGRVHAFDLDGRWLSSTDRNDNAKTATYNAMDRLERVDFPDKRYEVFTYDAAGRLDTITEHGVDGTSTRVWDYGWTGDDLTNIARPDGRSWSLLYDDPSYPGFISRLTLIGDDGTSERIEGAWEYDAAGNVMATWRGTVDATRGTHDQLAIRPDVSGFGDPHRAPVHHR